MNLLCVSVVLFSVIWPGNGQETGDPTITQDIQTETKPVGATGRMNCSVANLGSADNVLWIKVGGAEGKKDHRISVNLRVDTSNPVVNSEKKYDVRKISAGDTSGLTTIVYMLIIRRLREEDDGQYRCQIMRKGLDDSALWPARTGILNVQRPPLIEKSETPAMVYATAGDTVTLKCSAHGRPEPKIMWTRVGDNYIKAGDKYLPRTYGKELTIADVNEHDRGQYRCTADNNVKPPAKYDITLSVQFPPTAKAFRKSVGQAADRNYEIELNCKITGNPDPEVGWYQIVNGVEKRVHDDHKHDVEHINSRGPYLAVDESWFILRIRRLQQGDFGNYSCRASNQYGTGADYIELFLTRTCQGPNCYNDDFRSAAATWTFQLSLTLPVVVKSLVFFDWL